MKVKLKADGTLRIAQVTDVHLNHYPFDANDEEILADLERALAFLQPDLIMLTGDIVNTYRNPDERAIFAEFFDYLNRFAVPKAITYGNHDSENALDRMGLEELFSEIVELRAPREHESVLAERPNYCIEVWDETGKEVVQVLYVMDSGKIAPGEGRTDDWILPQQVEWFRQTSRNYMGMRNNLLFLHIPLPEYIRAKGNLVSGELREPEQLISATKVNTGLFSALYFSEQIYGVFCGHNHLNNAELELEGIHLFYGMFSGKEPKAGDFRGVRYIDVTDSARSVASDTVLYTDVPESSPIRA